MIIYSVLLGINLVDDGESSSPMDVDPPRPKTPPPPPKPKPDENSNLTPQQKEVSLYI